MKFSPKILSALLMAQCTVVFAKGNADTIFYGGPIVTVNAKNEEVQALAVQNGKIVAVGAKDAVTKEWQADNTKVIDLKGQTLMPGFIDPHIHIMMTTLYEYLWLNMANFSTNYDTIPTITDKLKAQVKNVKSGQWLLGFGVDPSRTKPFMAQLTVDDLDKVSTTVPIFIMNQSGHIAYVNHKAYEMVGITEKTPNPGNGGVFERDAQGKLNGVISEPPALLAFLTKLPLNTDTELAAAMQKTGKMIASKGVTTTTEQTVGANLGVDKEVSLLRQATATKDWPIRVRGYIYAPRIPKDFAIKPNEGDDRLRFIGVKFVADGSDQGFSGALEKPYSYPPNTTFRGNLDYKDEELYTAMKPFFDQGWQISVHANGDRAIQQTLDTYTKILAGNPHPEERRLRIEHFTINRPEQVKQVVKLGVVPGFTIGHVNYWGEAFHNEIVGPDRANRIDPAASIKKEGGRFTYHSDHPISPVNPLQYISTGVTRLWQKPPAKVLNPEERISVDDAIRAVTINAAYQVMSDDKIGSLEVGKQADLVVLAKNPRSTKPEEIANIKVKETWIDGKKQVW